MSWGNPIDIRSEWRNMLRYRDFIVGLQALTDLSEERDCENLDEE